MHQIGTITNLYIYPVKHMLAMEREEIFITKSGIQGDALYEFVDDTGTADYSWMTAAQKLEFNLFRPYEITRLPTNQYRIKIKYADTDRYDLTDDRLLAFIIGHYNRMFELKKQDPPHNSSVIKAISTQALQKINLETHSYLTPIKFHTHLGINWKNPHMNEKILEDKTIHIGNTVQLAVQTIGTAKDPVICLEVEKEGIIHMNDPIYMPNPGDTRSNYPNLANCLITTNPFYTNQFPSIPVVPA